ncbi:MAG: hydroxyacid dehydrogenase [Lachnospiraceae bacterium]|nr:hydroxyacid dehydrogenase [Lachnospiraceae bacterium]
MAKVLISEVMNPIAAQLLKEAGHEVVQMTSMDPEVLREYIKDCDAVVNRILPIDRAMMESNPNLKIISKHGVGLDNYDLPAAKELGIMVTCTPGCNAQSVAEHSIALMMASARNLKAVAGGYETIGWDAKKRGDGVELWGKTLGIVGCGDIGSRVARMLHGGFAMRVLVYDPYISKVPEGCELVGSLDEVLSQSDFISVHCFLSEETKHLIGEKEFAAMKKGAIFINCARGPIVDENALVKAVESGHLGAAAVDVTETEPLPKDHPLFALPNVIVTPHFAAQSREASYNVARTAAENVIHYFSDGKVVGRVV